MENRPALDGICSSPTVLFDETHAFSSCQGEIGPVLQSTIHPLEMSKLLVAVHEVTKEFEGHGQSAVSALANASDALKSDSYRQ